MSSAAPILKIAVFADGRVTFDGAPATIESLLASLAQLAAQRGIVYYYREESQQPPPIAIEVIRAVTAAKLPIRLSTKPDYSDAFEPVQSPAEQSRSRVVWLCIVIYLLAVGIYLITHSLILAILLTCASAARPNVKSALWIRQIDNRTARANVCCWFYLAAAGWRAATSALTTLLILGLVEAIRGIMPAEKTIERVSLSLLIGLGVATMLGFVGVVAALRAKVRVFVIPRLFDVCRGDTKAFILLVNSYRGFNHAIFPLAMSIFIPIIAIGATFLFASANGKPQAQLPVWNSVGLALLVLGPLAGLPLYAFCSVRIIAHTPLQCWPDALVKTPKTA